jgi:nucleotide-binding universal stress UspA family protein
MFRIRTILHGTDLSPPALAAFQIARDLARQNGARLLVLHAAPPPNPERISFREAEIERQPGGYLGHLRAEIEARLGLADEPGALCLVVEGEPVETIDRVARDRNCDLIVVGTHGWGRWHRLLMGSTAERLVSTAPCPVLTVKVPAETPPTGPAGGHTGD